MSLAKGQKVIVDLYPCILKESTDGKSTVLVKWTTGPWAGTQQKVDVSKLVPDSEHSSSSSREQGQEQRESYQEKKRAVKNDDGDDDEEWEEEANESPKKKAKTETKPSKSESKETEKRNKKKAVKSESKSTPNKPIVRYTFDERLEQCKSFKNENGHCKIPTTYKNKNNNNLGIWVQEIRRNYKLQMQGLKKPRRVIPGDQIKALDAIGFHWGYEAPPDAPQSDEAWTKCFEQVKEYHAGHKSFDIPLGSEHDVLAKWVRVQRSNKKKKDSKVKCPGFSADRIKLLDSIKFNWNGNRDIKFESKTKTVTSKKTSSAAVAIASKKATTKSSSRTASSSPSSSSSSSTKKKKTEVTITSKKDDSKKKAEKKTGKKGAKNKSKKDAIVDEEDEEESLPEPVPLKDINSRGDDDNDNDLQLYDWK